MGEDASLWALFAASFLAATLLPGGSEAVLFGLLKSHAAPFWPAIAVATVANTLGGLTSYAIGRALAGGHPTGAGNRHARALRWAQRFGSPVMLAAWVPILGDPLCVAAGWLRLNVIGVTVFMALGKLGRYLFVAWAAV
jgi:membrane protein YqaA with SNARE-associated domain